MQQLGQMQITSLLIEGGAQVHGAAFAAQIVDKGYWFIAPRIIGGREAPGPVGGAGFNNLAQTPVMVQKKITPLGADWLIEGSFRG
jgi:diaminohydroxyphosphoribosylaminopyrimidine deaminase/5-amino-6-(5-phosphoribosylamino)uracil reductase